MTSDITSRSDTASRITGKPGRTTRIQAALVFAVSVVVFLGSPVYIFGDSHFTLLLSHNILRHGHVRLDEYLAPPLDPRLLRHRPTTRVYQLQNHDGHTYYSFPVGSSVLSIPFIPLLNAVGLSSVRADGGYDVDGELRMQRILASVLMALLASIFFLTARLALPLSWSIVVAAGGAFGTQVWSTASRVLWSHTWGILLLGLVLLLLVASERRQARVNPFLLATLLAWMYFVRPVHSIAVVTVSAYMVLWRYDRASAVRYAVTGGAWLMLFVAYSYHYFEQVLPPYYLHRGFTLGATVPILKSYVFVAVSHLISPSRGVLVHVPVFIFLAYLLVRYRKTVPSVHLTALAVANIVGLFVVVSGFRHWWGGHSYGPRLLTDAVPWLVLLAIMAVDAMLRASTASVVVARRRRVMERAVGGILLILSIAIHARGAVCWDTVLWNYFPVDVDRRPRRLWDWGEPQLLAGVVRPLGPGAEVYDPRRPP